MIRPRLTLFLIAAAIVAVTFAARAQQAATPPPRAGEWRMNGADLASTHYSPVDQITAANSSSLRVAWRSKTDALAAGESTCVT